MNVLRDKKQDLIKAGATNTTTASAVVGALVVLVAAINPLWKDIFGGVEDALLTNEKAAVVIAVIAGWVVLASVDLIARAITTSNAQPRVVAAPPGATAKYTVRTDDPGYSVIAIRFDGAGAEEEQTKFLIVKAGKAPLWVTGQEIEFT